MSSNFRPQNILVVELRGEKKEKEREPVRTFRLAPLGLQPTYKRTCVRNTSLSLSFFFSCASMLQTGIFFLCVCAHVLDALGVLETLFVPCGCCGSQTNRWRSCPGPSSRSASPLRVRGPKQARSVFSYRCSDLRCHLGLTAIELVRTFVVFQSGL